MKTVPVRAECGLSLLRTLSFDWSGLIAAVELSTRYTAADTVAVILW